MSLHQAQFMNPNSARTIALVRKMPIAAHQDASEAPDDLIDDARLNTDYTAGAAIIAMKSACTSDPVYIDVVTDDRVMGRLCRLTCGVTKKLIRTHIELKLGKPTEDTIEIALIELENQNIFGSGTDEI